MQVTVTYFICARSTSIRQYYFQRPKLTNVYIQHLNPNIYRIKCPTKNLKYNWQWHTGSNVRTG